MDPQMSTIIQSEFQDIVQSLAALTTQHRQTFRLQVGQLVLQRFFGGQVALFHSRDRTKPAKLAAFLQIHGQELARLGLSEAVLRRCVRVRICYDLLPPGVRDALGYSLLLAISAVEDPNQRARLAAAATREQWTVERTRHAIELAQQRRLWDAAPDTPGLQLPEPKEPAAPQPGRLVTRTEKWGQELAGWHAEFAQIDKAKLSPAQLQRMQVAVQVAREQLAALEALLGA